MVLQGGAQAWHIETHPARQFGPWVPHHWPVQTGRGPRQDLPIQTGWRLGGQGALHLGADPARRFGAGCPDICMYKRAGVRAIFASTNGSVKKPSILGPIGPLSLAPRSRGICLYKSTAWPGRWIAISVDSPGGNLPILLAKAQYWVQEP